MNAAQEHDEVVQEKADKHDEVVQEMTDKHDEVIQEMAYKHFETFRTFDRLTGIILIAKKGEDRMTEGLDDLADYIYKARQDAFKLGRNR